MTAAAVMNLRPSGAGVITLLKIQTYKASVGVSALAGSSLAAPSSLATGGFISKVGGSMRSIRNLFFVDKITKNATLTPERQMYCLAFCST